MFGLDVDTLGDMRQLFQQFSHIEKVILYGSRAKGNYRKGSDIDITLIGKDLSLDNTVDPLIRKIDDLNLPYTFDISIFKQLDNLDLIDHILRVGKTFYEKEDKNFPMVKLRDVCKIVGGGTPSTSKEEYWNGSIPWITPKDLSNHTNRSISKGARSITLEGLKKSSAKKLPKNTILLSTRAPIGYVGIAKNVITTNQGFRNLILKKECIPEYIYYILKSKKDFLNSLGSGTTFKELSGSKIKEIKIPLPPLAIQRKIVTLLDRAFEAIDKAIKNTETNLKSCQELFDSYLHDIFSNYDDKQKACSMIQLGEVCNPEYGYTTSARSYGKYRFVRITDIDNNGLLKLENKKYISPKENIKKFILKATDILVVRTGATYGKTLLFEDSEPSVFASYLIRLCFSKNKINHKFYWCFSQSQAYWNQVQSLVSGAGQPQFNANAIVKIKIPLPSLDIQKKIVDRFDKFNKENRKLESLYQKKLESLKELKKSILQQAFHCRGKRQ